MAKRLDGIKSVTKKARATAAASKKQNVAVRQSKQDAPSKKADPPVAEESMDKQTGADDFAWPSVHVQAPAEALRNWRDQRDERRQQAKEGRRQRALEKQERKSQKEQARLARIEAERTERLEQQWSKAKQAKSREQQKRSAREMRRRARAKLKAERLANKLNSEATKSGEGMLRLPRVRLHVRVPEKIKGGARRFTGVARRGLRRAVVIVAIAAIAYAVVAVALLRLPHTTPLVTMGRRVVPLPALAVNGWPVAYRRYQRETLLDRAYADLAQRAIANDITARWATMPAAERLARKVVLERLARDYGVDTANVNYDDARQQYVAAFGGEDALEDVLYNTYGITRDMFANDIVYYNALYVATANGYRQDDRAHRSTRVRLEAVIEKFRDGDASFAELAKTYSEDEYALTGGDRGYVAFADMPTALQQAVRSLKPGEASGILHGENRYYIVQLQEEIPADAEEAWLRQISLVTHSDFDARWQEIVNHMSVWQLVQN